MNYERSQTPTTVPLLALAAPQSSPAFSPLLGLQGLIGNAGLLDLLRPQMPGAQADAGPSPLTGALQTVLQQDATAPTPPPGGTEAPSTAVAATLADEGQTAALTSAPSSPAQSSAAQVTALDETQDGVEGAITDSPALTTAVAAELGTTPSDVAAQAQDPWQPSWWDDVVDWTVGGMGSVADATVEAVADVPLLGVAAQTVAPVARFAREAFGGFAKGAGDMVGGIANIVAHPLDFLGGVETMLEHVPGSPIKAIHKLYDIAAGNKTLDETFRRNPIDVFTEDLGGDYDFWAKVVGAVIDPYERSVEQGKYGEAVGRGILDLGSMLVGAGEVKALGKGAEAVSVLNKVDEAVRVANKVNEFGAVTDDLVRAGGKAEDVTRVATHTDEAADLSKADDATKLASQPDEAAKPATTAEDAPVVQTGTTATPEDYVRIRTKADVPEHYSSDPRFDGLSSDPDHAGQVTDKSVKEAMTGLEAERQGLVKPPIERGPKGIEFYDADGIPYDVKTPPSPPPGAPYKFKPTESGKSILKQIRKKAPNKQSGQEEFVQVMLDTSYMTPEDLATLREFLQKNASPEELDRIIELNVQL